MRTGRRRRAPVGVEAADADEVGEDGVAVEAELPRAESSSGAPRATRASLAVLTELAERDAGQEGAARRRPAPGWPWRSRPRVQSTTTDAADRDAPMRDAARCGSPAGRCGRSGCGRSGSCEVDAPIGMRPIGESASTMRPIGMRPRGVDASGIGRWGCVPIGGRSSGIGRSGCGRCGVPPIVIEPMGSRRGRCGIGMPRSVRRRGRCARWGCVPIGSRRGRSPDRDRRRAGCARSARPAGSARTASCPGRRDRAPGRHRGAGPSAGRLRHDDVARTSPSPPASGIRPIGTLA